MKTLERRIVALEGPCRDPYAHLTDEQIRERIIEIMEKLEPCGLVPPDRWREMISGVIAGDHLALHAFTKEIRCAISNDG